MSTANFYSELPTLTDFLDITNSSNFIPVPEDWYIVITDIVESTKAIESGHYKDVNLLGACSIVAVLNTLGNGANSHKDTTDIPFVFGGDGATILIPPGLFAKTKQALSVVQQLAVQEFGMDLRVGIVPVSVAIAANYDVKVAKLKVSENYSQSVFIGGGLTYATELLKDPNATEVYRITPEKSFADVDLSGLECRWQDIPSQHGEFVSLIVMATAYGSENLASLYAEIINKIQQIYGDEVSYRPVHSKTLNLTFSSKKLSKETKLRAKSGSRFHKQLYLWKIQLENLLGLFLMHFKTQAGEMDWGTYKDIVVGATDYKKFDDMLRMVISGTAAQREALNSYLETKYKQGKLVYGTYTSDRALMTCMVFERNGPQVHFVDGADGGYTLAAKALKERMKQKALNWSTFVRMMRRRDARGYSPRPDLFPQSGLFSQPDLLQTSPLWSNALNSCTLDPHEGKANSCISC
ncbi:DUF3095 domain-containing protein [Cyanobacteria bacterium FACHB-471]|nr:DUF3095 domain-containing protein [Cyanobacteria bacterium FACHB-471]